MHNKPAIHIPICPGSCMPLGSIGPTVGGCIPVSHACSKLLGMGLAYGTWKRSWFFKNRVANSFYVQNCRIPKKNWSISRGIHPYLWRQHDGHHKISISVRQRGYAINQTDILYLNVTGCLQDHVKLITGFSRLLQNKFFLKFQT